MSRSGGDPLVAFIGNALMGIGAVMTALCGGCTLVAGVGMISDLVRERAYSALIPYVLSMTVFGFVPAGIGLALYFGGRSMARSAQGGPK